MKPKKKRKTWLIPVGIVAAIILFCAVGAIVGLSRRAGGNAYINSDAVRTVEDTENAGIGNVEIRTLPVPDGVTVRRASYSASGNVILNYQKKQDGQTVRGVAVMHDDGTGFRSIYVGNDSVSRLLPYADNRRILTGDGVIECPEGTDLDTCGENAAQYYRIVFPEEFTSDSRVSDIWSEVIVAPDGEHFAFTMLRSDCGAAVALGTLEKVGSVYRVQNAKLVSRMNVYRQDEANPGYLLRESIIGGEVKQFVHGGAAIALVGADQNGDAQSVTMDVATGEYTMITKTLGYDETTIFSPNEVYGMVMTTRFSDSTRMDALGLLPRPIGDPLNNITSTIYLYAVTGVRSEREGNIGPALIRIDRSMEDSDYLGLDLSDPDGNWVFHSPLSWNDTSTKAMWTEKQRSGNGYRVQIATLLDAQPSEPVPTVQTPTPGNYADTDSAVQDISGKIAGKVSGYAEFTRKTGFLNKKTVTVVYHDYSDDGVTFYNGVESSSGSVLSRTVYTADLAVTDASGKELGSMDAELHFSAAYRLASAFTGSTSPQLDTASSHITATWNGATLTGDNLLP